MKTASTGRPKRFCGQRCRKASNRSFGVPAELRQKRRWVRHLDKRPLTIGSHPASVTNPDTWASFDEAKASKAGNGLGFVLGAGIGCLDFDHVIGAKGLHPSVRALLEELPSTWIEVSPSGDGLHVWGYLPEGGGRVFFKDGVKIERYSRGRYITVTGNRFEAAPLQLADLSQVLSW